MTYFGCGDKGYADKCRIDDCSTVGYLTKWYNGLCSVFLILCMWWFTFVCLNLRSRFLTTDCPFILFWSPPVFCSLGCESVLWLFCLDMAMSFTMTGRLLPYDKLLEYTWWRLPCPWNDSSRMLLCPCRHLLCLRRISLGSLLPCLVSILGYILSCSPWLRQALWWMI
jgi:hypothetical protein